MTFKCHFQPKSFYDCMIFSESRHPWILSLLNHDFLSKYTFTSLFPQLQILVELCFGTVYTKPTINIQLLLWFLPSIFYFITFLRCIHFKIPCRVTIGSRGKHRPLCYITQQQRAKQYSVVGAWMCQLRVHPTFSVCLLCSFGGVELFACNYLVSLMRLKRGQITCKCLRSLEAGVIFFVYRI